MRPANRSYDEEPAAVAALGLLLAHWPSAMARLVTGSTDSATPAPPPTDGSPRSAWTLQVLTGAFGCLRDGASFPPVLVTPRVCRCGPRTPAQDVACAGAAVPSSRCPTCPALVFKAHPLQPEDLRRWRYQLGVWRYLGMHPETADIVPQLCPRTPDDAAATATGMDVVPTMSVAEVEVAGSVLPLDAPLRVDALCLVRPSGNAARPWQPYTLSTFMARGVHVARQAAGLPHYKALGRAIARLHRAVQQIRPCAAPTSRGDAAPANNAMVPTGAAAAVAGRDGGGGDHASLGYIHRWVPRRTIVRTIDAQLTALEHDAAAAASTRSDPGVPSISMLLLRQAVAVFHVNMSRLDTDYTTFATTTDAASPPTSDGGDALPLQWDTALDAVWTHNDLVLGNVKFAPSPAAAAAGAPSSSSCAADADGAVEVVAVLDFDLSQAGCLLDELNNALLGPNGLSTMHLPRSRPEVGAAAGTATFRAMLDATLAGFRLYPAGDASSQQGSALSPFFASSSLMLRCAIEVLRSRLIEDVWRFAVLPDAAAQKNGGEQTLTQGDDDDTLAVAIRANRQQLLRQLLDEFPI